MGVIRHERPCVTVRFSLRQEFRLLIEEIMAIFIVYKYPSTLYPPDRNSLVHSKLDLSEKATDGRKERGQPWKIENSLVKPYRIYHCS